MCYKEHTCTSCIDFDTILAKKKEGEEKEEEEEEVVERNGEMESGPSFRTLVSIGGRVQVSSWAAGS